MEHICNRIQGWCNFYDLYNSIIQYMPNNFSFAEVGVWKGHSLAYFTVEAINRKKSGTIYAIDHWQGSREHLDPSNPSYEPILANNPDGLYEHFLSNIAAIKEYLTIIRKSSADASTLIADRSLDAIFIDASHEYEDVYQDIELWLPKVKTTGLFCGHDYDWPGVKKAVDEYAHTHQHKVKPVSNTCWMLLQKLNP